MQASPTTRRAFSVLALTAAAALAARAEPAQAAVAETASADTNPMTLSVKQLGRDYAAAWSSHSPKAVADFFADEGQISINGAEPDEGPAAIAFMAAGFYAAFPDLIVRCDEVRSAGRHAVFVWTLEGHHAKTKNFVKIGGWEEWELEDDGKIELSRGWYDTADFDRQIAGTASTAG